MFKSPILTYLRTYPVEYLTACIFTCVFLAMGWQFEVLRRVPFFPWFIVAQTLVMLFLVITMSRAHPAPAGNASVSYATHNGDRP